MSNIAINTTQNVNLDYTIAGLGERILAFLIDGVILYAYMIFVQGVMSIFGVDFLDQWTVIGLQSLLFLPVMLYSFYMHIIFNGRTVGKMVVKTRVVKTDGNPVHWSNYGIRWMLRLVDIWLLFGAIGMLAIIFGNRRQRVGDAAAGTIVISVKNKVHISHTILEDIEEGYQPVFLNVTKLTDKDVRLAKEAYLIAKKSRDYKTLKILREKIETVLEVQSELYDEQFIDTVLKDYNHFTQQM